MHELERAHNAFQQIRRSNGGASPNSEGFALAQGLTTNIVCGDRASVLGRAMDIYQRATVVQLPGGISYLSGVFFGEGVLIDQNKGSGAIFIPGNPSAGTLFFSNLMGDYSVQRGPDGTTAIVTPGLW